MPKQFCPVQIPKVSALLESQAMIGELLGGRYRVTEVLAIGGFGQTYVAADTHRPGSPKCVVKQLKPISGDPTLLGNARRLFQAEAETLEKLGDHDQIPRLLAHLEENQEFYLVQEFIAGHCLSTELPLSHCWSENQVVQFLQEVLQILEFVHSHRLIHRDIKPGNLIRRQQDQRLVLIDFGSVKQAWTQVITTTTGMPTTIAIGTPGYIPTEQGRGKPRASSDIYALGIIGIQALTGLHPTQLQEDVDTGEIVWRHQAKVSDRLAAILTKMVRYHFRDRYQTATEVLQALQPLIHPSLSLHQLSLSVGVPPLPSLHPPQTIVLSPPLISNQFSGRSGVSLVLANPTPLVASQHHSSTATFQSQQHLTPVTSANVPDQERNTTASHNQRRLLVGAGLTAVILSIFAGCTTDWQPRTKTSQALAQIEALKAEQKYQKCAVQATGIPSSSRFYAEAQALSHECLLAQAIQLAADHDFTAAIAAALKLPQTSTFYHTAQQLISQWSVQVLRVAANHYWLGKLDEAIVAARVIPETSPAYSRAQAAIKQWDEDWEKSRLHLQAAEIALAAGKWQQAISEAKQVAATPYWQQQVKPLLQLAATRAASSQFIPPKSESLPNSQSSTTQRSPNPVTRKPTPSVQPRRTSNPATRQSRPPARSRRASTAVRRSTPPTKLRRLPNPAAKRPNPPSPSQQSSGWQVEIR